MNIDFLHEIHHFYPLWGAYWYMERNSLTGIPALNAVAPAKAAAEASFTCKETLPSARSSVEQNGTV